MAYRINLMLAVISILIAGCTATREITYSLKSIDPVSSTDSTYAVTRSLRLCVEPFEDDRQTVAENGILFVRERETKLYDKDYCINAEEHYKQNTVPIQVATIMAGHFAKRGTFKSVSSGSKEQSEYSLTGRLRRLYGEQEFSSSARVGSLFGLIGALATAGATTNAKVIIEFTDLVVHRKSDGAEKRLEDVYESFSGELHADAYCWCIYENVNDQMRASVDKLAVLVENAVAELEASKP